MALWKRMTALKWVSLVVISIMAWGVTGSMGQGCVMATIGEKKRCCCDPSGGGPKKTLPSPCHLGALPCGCEFVDPHRLLIYREPQPRGLALYHDSRNMVCLWYVPPVKPSSINEHQFTGCMIPSKISRHLVLGILLC